MARKECDLQVLVAMFFGLFSFPTGESSSYFYNENGVVRPINPRPFVGENLTLYCNITKRDVIETSSRMYFTRDGDAIAPEYVDVINSRTIRLRYPITRLEDEGHFVCWLNRTYGDRLEIGFQTVEADYRPAKVDSINCTVYNWENMTCLWDLKYMYQYPKRINVSLVWTTSGPQRDCPTGYLTATSCTWVRHPGEEIFQPDSIYYMSVEVKSISRNVTEQSATFHFNTRYIVKPAPVDNFRVVSRNATCLCFEWSHSDIVHSKMAVIEFHSEWHLGQWKEVEPKTTFTNQAQVCICNLTPYTQYTVRIAVWPLFNGGPSGYISDWTYKIEWTDQSVPEVAPAMCAGCFAELQCAVFNCRHVILYWKPIPRQQQHSIIWGYHLEFHDDANAVENRTIFNPATFFHYGVLLNRSYTVHLYAVTDRNGYSLNHSTLRLPAHDQKPAPPESFIVEIGNETGQELGFYLRWKTDSEVFSFTAVWCRGSKVNVTCDRNETIHWKDLLGNATNFNISVFGRPDDYIVGLSRQVSRPGGNVISSGISWAPCFYLRDTVPRKAPEGVIFASVQTEESLMVEWEQLSCSDSGSYVTHYLVQFCIIDIHHQCTGTEQNVTVDRGHRETLLNGLVPDAYYRVQVTAVSEFGVGRPSKSIYAKVTAAQMVKEPLNFTIIGCVLGLLLFLLIIMVGICKLRKLYPKGQEKFSLKSDLPPLPSDKIFSDCSHFKDRPLPQPPSQITATTLTDSSGFASEACGHGNNWRNKSGKHESITSETSLLGHEEHNEDDNKKRRRHKSKISSSSEKARLLPEDVTTPEKHVASKYESDSGADSPRYSGERSDHDYDSVESGGNCLHETSSSEECKSDYDDIEKPARGDELGKVNSYVKNVPGYMFHPENQAGAPAPLGDEILLTSHEAELSVLPFHFPANGGIVNRHLQPEKQPLMTTFGTGTPNFIAEIVNPSNVRCTKEPTSHVTSPQLLTPAAYSFSDNRTLPMRTFKAPSVRHNQSQETSLDANASPARYNLMDSNASGPVHGSAAQSNHMLDAAIMPSFSGRDNRHGTDYDHIIPNFLCQQDAGNGGSGSSGQEFLHHSTGGSSCGGVAEGASNNPEGSDGIYSPPWESSGLLSQHLSNRPLSAYMLQLPLKYFVDPEPRVHDGPTTDL